MTIRFGLGQACDLTRAARKADAVLAHELPELRKQNERAAGLIRRLYEDDAPGVLLADEVGKGKTYVALGAAFAVLATKKQSRIVILTHSRRMADEWSRRWRVEMRENCPGFASRFDDDWAPVRFDTIEALHQLYDGRPPRIAIGSYETLKKYGDALDEASYLAEILHWVNECFAIHLSEGQRRSLMRQALGTFDFRRTLRRVRVTKREAHDLLRACFDAGKKEWRVKPARVRDFLDRIQADRHNIALARQIDLLIIDEAHKLEGTARQRVITRLLRRRFRKCLFVTATPFALSVEQFRHRLLEFANASTCPRSFSEEINALPLKEFARAVADDDEYGGKARLETALRRYMVREPWDHSRSRRVETWRAAANTDALVPTLVLERVIDAVLSAGERTHIASRRESLCSSWAAATESLERAPIAHADGWDHILRRMVTGSAGAVRPDPKMTTAVEKLVELAQRGEKTVVFTERIATARLLKKLLEAKLADVTSEMLRRAERWRRLAPRLSDLLQLSEPEARLVAKIIAHDPAAPERWTRSGVRAWWRRIQPRAFPRGREDLKDLEPALGYGRRLPVVVRFDAESGDEESHPIEKFNLPSAPLILLASPKAQEGIDLHRFCRRVVLYDLTWNPAHMEQRIGRVHRLGGAHSDRNKVEVVYCYQEGTYEAHMAKRVQERCKMLRVLLGAGQWLDEDTDIAEAERYSMTFPP